MAGLKGLPGGGVLINAADPVVRDRFGRALQIHDLITPPPSPGPLIMEVKSLTPVPPTPDGFPGGIRVRVLCVMDFIAPKDTPMQELVKVLDASERPDLRPGPTEVKES